MNFREYLSVNKNNMNDRLTKHASVYYDVGYKLVELEDALRRLDQKLDLTEAKIYRNMSVKYSALKNITATRINAEVACHEEIIELKEEKLTLVKAVALAKLKMKTLESLSETLVNYSHNVRGERKSSKLKGV
jgi:predicted S18 family serine protease